MTTTHAADLATMTPAQVDEASLPARDALALAAARHGECASIVRNGAQEGDRYGRGRVTAEQVARATDKLPALKRAVDAARVEVAPFDAEFDRRGGWTRSYLVVTKGRGHVHSSTGCGSCYSTTVFAWLVEWADRDEADVIAAAGEGACSYCFPNAPVDTRNRPLADSMLTPAMREAKAEKARAAQAKADAAAVKGITAPDGSPLTIRDHGSRRVLKTEVAARRAAAEAAGSLAWYASNGGHSFDAEWRTVIATCVEAIAHKTGEDAAELAATITAKAEKRTAAERRKATA